MAPYSSSGSVRVTITNGRAQRFEQKFRPFPTRVPVKQKRNARVCLLSAKAAKAFEHWGITHPCRAGGHPHFSRMQIEEMIETGEVRYIDSVENVAAWKQARHLAIRRSGPVACVQLVDVGR